LKKLSSLSVVVLLVASSGAEDRAPGREPAGSQAPAPRVPGRDPRKLQVLILTGYNMHDWRPVTEALRSTLEVTGRFEVRVNEEPSAATSGRSTATTRSS
jgi:hypothetical protein